MIIMRRRRIEMMMRRIKMMRRRIEMRRIEMTHLDDHIRLK